MGRRQIVGEGLGRRVWEMRLVQVDPAEPGAAGLRPQPARGRRNRVTTRALLLEKRRPRGGIDKAVVVDIESPGEAEARIEWKTADERAGGEATGLQHRGERLFAPRETKAGVVADAVLGREPAGQDAGVRGQRDNRVRVRIVEPDTRRREPVDDGRRCGRVAVRAKRVSPERVDRYEENIASRRLPCSQLTTRATRR